MKLIAPKGKFRVVGVDTFSNESYPLGIFKKLEKAKGVVDKHGGVMNPVYCYNDKGKMVYTKGSY